MLTLFLALLCGDVSPSPGRPVLTHDLAKLTAIEASLLNGKRCLFRVRLNTPEDTEPGYILYGCVSADDVERGVWLVAGQEVEDEMVVEATLRVLHFAEDGPFPPFTEYRLMGAVRR